MDVFAALADPVRRDLVSRLAHGPSRVVDLAGAHAISRPAISRHLRVLGEAGLVAVEDIGRERHYRLERSGLAPLTGYLSDLAPLPRSDAAVRLDDSVRFDDSVLDGLDLEVRRTVRERTATTSTATSTATRSTTGTTTAADPAPTTTEETA